MTAGQDLRGPWDDFRAFAVARKSHWPLFREAAQELFGRAVDPGRCDLKPYQDLLVLSFIRDNVPPGSRLLEIGGGNSRVLAHLAGTYECWNIDKFEGVGNGPLEAREAGYRIVRDYIGNASPELPDGYFDLVFSISTLEHVPDEDTAHLDAVLQDMDRVLRPGGLSLHCLDILFKADGVWTNRILPRIHESRPTLHPWVPLDGLAGDDDLFYMTREAYEAGWVNITKTPYETFGRPSSANVLWRKPPRPAPAPVVRTPAGRNLPRISIVTPSFNQARYLEECMDSLLSQGYPNLEYVVMDGGSTDGSVEIIKRHERHLAHWRSRPDRGQYWAVNAGLRLSSGECLGWLNSDDKHHPGSLFLLAALFSEFPEVRWVMGRPCIWTASGDLEMVLEPLPRWERSLYLLGRVGPPHIQQESTFWRRSLWLEAGGGPDPSLGYAGDLELWSRFFRHARLHTADMLLGGFRRQPESKTSTAMDAYDAEARTVIAREADLARVAGSTSPAAPEPIALEEVLRRSNGLEGCPQAPDLARAYAAYAEALPEPGQAAALRRLSAVFAEYGEGR